MSEANGGQSDQILSVLGSIYKTMSARRRQHLLLVIVLMLLGGIAELLTIGAVIPFLALISGPTLAADMPLFGGVIETFGLLPGHDLVAAATAMLILVAVGAAGMRLLLVYVSNTFVFRLGHEIATAIFDRMLRQPYSLFVRRNTSDQIAGMEKVEIVVGGVLLPLLLSVTSTVMATFIVALLFVVDPFVATIAAATMSVIYLLLAMFTRRRLRSNSAVISSHRNARIKQIQEGLGGIREIILDQSQPVFERKFEQLDREMTERQAANSVISAAPRYVVEGAGVVLIALVAYFMSLRPGGIAAAIPVLGALALGAQRLLPLLQQAFVGWSNFMGHSSNLQDVLSLLEAPVSSVAARAHGQPVQPFHHDIAIRSLSFGYRDDHKVLSNINLTIAKGERIGFVGRTGSGKTTLLDLLMSLLEPTEGTIEIDGATLTDLNRASWQAQIAHVPQAIYLTDSSIAANIAFGEEPAQIDMKRIRAAARQAQIEEFVLALPEGFETEVGERGIRLSGGQRQRIGIARSLYKRANVLVFDEATSALDNETEAALMETIDGLGRELTVFIIAHRLSTVANCDRVIRLEAGRIMADGPFHEVTGPVIVTKQH